MKVKLIDFGVLALRWYLIVYMLSYGFSKLTLSQFGVHDDSILEQPIKDIDSFYVAWHLFGRSTFFNIATGLLEILGGLLLIFNRTVLLGALIVLSVLAQILIIYISFTTLPIFLALRSR
ncbi:DoxX family membrane protein [Maribacter halichondriae]|uniref:DoxX family membrane protein n=1 Tax=Maribacter halichondriae TaxID=2980554 RepID=UPI002358CB25|nr:DoxX family membrane protein [Maribacter sp. Hal144]